MPLELGSPEWFAESAFRSLKRDPQESGVWDFTDSALLWSPDALAFYRSLQKSSAYGEIVTDEETTLLGRVAQQITASLPSSFLYVDLGPGTEHKERFFLEAIQTQGKDCIYIPVDIHRAMLQGAADFAQQYGVKVHPLNAPFETVHSLLPESSLPRFVSLGGTFNNYYPSQACLLLRAIVGTAGSAYITVQLRDKVDLALLRAAYTSESVLGLLRLKLKLLGIEAEDHHFEATDEVIVYYTVGVVPQALEERGMVVGDRIKVAVSFRHAEEELVRELNKHFHYSFFGHEGSLRGILLKAK